MSKPIVIAHRGASGYRPEHTLAAYELAIQQGADFIEPDVVSTRDGVLIARHENLIDETTDVASHPEFADRRTTKLVDYVSVTGWFAEDFTLAELKTLRAVERLPDLRPESAAHNGKYAIPTLAEIIELASAHRVGIYPETKHPAYFASLGLSLEEPLLETIGEINVPIYIQSFEAENLQKLRSMTRHPLIRLLNVGNVDETGLEGLAEIAKYAHGIGTEKELVIPRDDQGGLGFPTSLVRDAHAAGLVVHVWTFRNESAFLPRGLQPSEEYRRFLDAGIDGLFTDFPDAARQIVG